MKEHILKIMEEWAKEMRRVQSIDEVTRLAVSLAAEGKDMVEIAQALDAQGHLTSKGLRHSQLSVWGLLREHRANARRLH